MKIVLDTQNSYSCGVRKKLYPTFIGDAESLIPELEPATYHFWWNALICHCIKVENSKKWYCENILKLYYVLNFLS